MRLALNPWKSNLELSHAQGQDADDGGPQEAVKGDVTGGGLWTVGSHSKGDGGKVEEPLDAVLVRGLADALLHR